MDVAIYMGVQRMQRLGHVVSEWALSALAKHCLHTDVVYCVDSYAALVVTDNLGVGCVGHVGARPKLRETLEQPWLFSLLIARDLQEIRRNNSGAEHTARHEQGTSGLLPRIAQPSTHLPAEP